MHKFVDELPDNTHFIDDENKGDFEKVFDLIVNYAVQCYGMKDLRQKVKSRPGTMLLNLITTSDMGYAKAVVEDHMDYWDHVIRIEDKAKEEKKKYVKKNQGAMTLEEKERCMMTSKTHTSKEDRKNEFGKDDWSHEGKQFYMAAWGKWRKFLSSQDF